MTTLRTAAQQALEALKMMRDEYEEYACPACDHADAAIYALKTALAEPVQEPVKFWPLAPLTGYYDVGGKRVWLEKDEPFPAPPQRKPLTDEEIAAAYASCKYGSVGELARAIERAHGIGETK